MPSASWRIEAEQIRESFKLAPTDHEDHPLSRIRAMRNLFLARVCIRMTGLLDSAVVSLWQVKASQPDCRSPPCAHFRSLARAEMRRIEHSREPGERIVKGHRSHG